MKSASFWTRTITALAMVLVTSVGWSAPPPGKGPPPGNAKQPEAGKKPLVAEKEVPKAPNPKLAGGKPENGKPGGPSEGKGPPPGKGKPPEGKGPPHKDSAVEAAIADLEKQIEALKAKEHELRERINQLREQGKPPKDPAKEAEKGPPAKSEKG